MINARETIEIAICLPPRAFTDNPRGISAKDPKIAGASLIANKDFPIDSVSSFNSQTDSGG